MSLDVGSLEPHRGAMHPVPAAFRRTPRHVPSTPKSAVNPAAVHLVDATRLFRHFEQQLPEGEHVFSQLRQEFAAWCKEGGVTPPSVNQLAAWLRAAGLTASRRGRAKVTVYSKARHALAA